MSIFFFSKTTYASDYLYQKVSRTTIVTACSNLVHTLFLTLTPELIVKKVKQHFTGKYFRINKRTKNVD